MKIWKDSNGAVSAVEIVVFPPATLRSRGWCSVIRTKARAPIFRQVAPRKPWLKEPWLTEPSAFLFVWNSASGPRVWYKSWEEKISFQLWEDDGKRLYSLFPSSSRHFGDVERGELRWFLERVRVLIEPEDFQKLSKVEKFLRRLLSVEPVSGTFVGTTPEELRMYDALGEDYPFFWDDAMFFAWALERPEAEVLAAVPF